MQVARLEGLERYTIVRRENRFVVTVRRGGGTKRALLRNTGRLYELLRLGYTALCAERSGGKTGCEILGILVGDDPAGRAVLVDPYAQARVFEISAHRRLIPWLDGWAIESREVPIEGSRLDYRITDGRNEGYLELKSAAFCDGYYAMYPDCPSERGLRHIVALRRLKTLGCRSVIAFVAAHPYARAFRPNREAHEELASNLSSARREGVEVYALKVFLDADGNVFLDDPDLPVELEQERKR